MAHIAEWERAEEMIRRGYRSQEVLSSLLQLSLEDMTLEEQLERALDTILAVPWLSILPKGCIFLVEDEPDVLVLKTQRGMGTPLLSLCARVPFGRCLCGQAAATGESQFSGCVDPRHEIAYEDMEDHGHYNTPIILDGKVIGVINLYLKAGAEQDEYEVSFLQTVANTLASLIQRKRIDDEQLMSEARYRSLVETSHDLLWSVDREGNWTYLNQVAEQIYGYSPEEMIGRSFIEFTEPEHVEKDTATFMRVLNGESLTNYETSHIRRDGSSIILWFNIVPTRDRAGNIIGATGIAHDATQRVHLEERVQKSLEKRSLQVQLSTNIAQEIAAAADLNDLYRRVVTLVKEQFQYYHVQLLRYDPSLDTIALVVGYGEVGEKMLEMNHSSPWASASSVWLPLQESQYCAVVWLMIRIGTPIPSCPKRRGSWLCPSS